MALYSQATDLQTKSIVWVSRNVVKGRPQLNSHRQDRIGNSLKDAGVDGLPAVELADLHTNYQGWQLKTPKYRCNPEAKRLSFSV